MSICTVIVVDGSPALEWMSKLFTWSHKRAGQPGDIVRIWCSDETPTPFEGKTYITANYAYHKGDFYHPYNRIIGIRDWLRDDPPTSGTTVHVSEHDILYLEQWPVEVELGTVVGHGPIDWRTVPAQRNPEWAKRHTKYPQRLSGIGVPYAIQVDDLRNLFSDMMERTEAIRDDPAEPHGRVWIDEEYALGFALADAPLDVYGRINSWHFAADYQHGRFPMLHYSWSYDSPNWSWAKYNYVPWTDPGLPPADAPKSVHLLVAMLQEYRATLGYA